MTGLMTFPQKRIKISNAKSWNTLFSEGGLEKKPSKKVNSPYASNEFSSWMQISYVSEKHGNRHGGSYYVVPRDGIAEQIGKSMVVSGSLYWKAIVFEDERMVDIYVTYNHILASRFVARVMLKTLPKKFPKP